eukprot:TRINITY_DN31687_c0_g1_i1.p2 TRINITY_DN31687_c0_g1~~TRINITY_DN31687_c0_g1_i1.p2  ORF type:complete len:133 (-),score=14.59 TRINITY_DN31687_c0_g1_i1:217-615(-)
MGEPRASGGPQLPPSIAISASDGQAPGERGDIEKARSVLDNVTLRRIPGRAQVVAPQSQRLAQTAFLQQAAANETNLGALGSRTLPKPPMLGAVSQRFVTSMSDIKTRRRGPRPDTKHAEGHKYDVFVDEQA